ncbi:hypothetical protein CPB86DRAFT_821089 [Serendipita vermifera]|nr:hypothetical protein CPB86DRAFT_821089 [Serendipita vermifera]
MDHTSWLPRRWTDMDAFITGCGSLRKLPNVHLTSQMLHAMKGKLDLREVTTCDNIIAVSSILETVPNVDKVTFMGFYSREDEQSSLPINDSKHQFNGQLPWKELVYSLSSHPFPVPFLRQLPMLTSLDVNVSWDTLKETTLMLHNLPNLQSFTFSTFVEEADTLTPPPPPKTICPNIWIRYLSVTIYYPESDRYLDNARDVIIEMILRAVPMAENISLSTYNVPHSFQFLALDGCRQAKKLNLFAGREWDL